MSTITKEFTKEQLQQIEAAAKEVMWPVVWSEKKAREHFSEKITPKVVLKLARIALASLEAEAVGEVVLGEFDDSGCHPDARVVCIAADGQADWDNFKDGTRLYTSPPAPVSVPDEVISAIENLKQTLVNCKRYNYCSDAVKRLEVACRAAMLQGADGNHPVIPDGWVAVPVEPTEHMIVEGFESEPDEFFSDAEVWEAYDAMSGCQQAAHRAKLCWAAMIAAAPKPEVK